MRVLLGAGTEYTGTMKLRWLVVLALACATQAYESKVASTAWSTGGGATTACASSNAAPKYRATDGTCQDCPAKYTCDGTTATWCQHSENVPKYVTGNVCTPCGQGFTCDGESQTCTSDRYVTNGVCEECPAGYVCNGATKMRIWGMGMR